MISRALTAMTALLLISSGTIANAQAAAAAQSSCLELFDFTAASSVSTESLPTSALSAPIPGIQLNERGLFQPISLSNNIIMPAAAQHHIMHGDYKMMPASSAVGHVPAIDGGVHTPDALAHFIGLRPDIGAWLAAHPESRHVMQNGVTQLQLPLNAFSGQYDHTGKLIVQTNPNATELKSLYPPDWTPQKIVAAIDEVIRTGTPSPHDPSKITGVSSGVKLNVVLFQGPGGVTMVKTAYPAVDQPRLTQP
jgi:hypothetical protein